MQLLYRTVWQGWKELREGALKTLSGLWGGLFPGISRPKGSHSVPVTSPTETKQDFQDPTSHFLP